MIYENEPSDEQRAIIECAELDAPLKVIAGAGTGKTFVLAHRFVWLVVERGLPPERLLALTFSEAAAAEMKARIRKLLRRNAGSWEDRPAGRLWIQNFHSFAVRLLAEHSYAAGLPPDPELLSDTRQRLAMQALLDGLLAGDFSDRNPLLTPEALASLGLDSSTRLAESLTALLRRAKCYGQSPEAFRTDALGRADAFFDALLSPEEAWKLDPMALPHVLRDRLAAGLGDPRIAQIDWAKYGDHADIRRLYYSAIDQRGGKQPVPHAGLANSFERQERAERALIEVTASLYELYQQQLAARGALDFDDQIIRATELLERDDRRLGRELAGYFEYILVDEFQDTSPAQMALIQAVARRPQVEPGDPESYRHAYPRLLLVGDKKQSIYGWRNATPGNMDAMLPFEAGDRIRGHQVWHGLQENRRSGRAIIASANRAAQQAGPGDPPLLLTREAPGRVVCVAPFVPGAGEGQRHTRRREAAALAEKIARLVSGLEPGSPPVRPGDIGVLMRQRRSFRYLKLALEQRGLPYQDRGGVGFFDHPVARDILAWLRVLTDPLDSASLARLLQRPPVGLTDRMLFLLVTEPELRRDTEADDEQQLERRPRSVYAMLEAFMAGQDDWRSESERAELPRERLRDFHARLSRLQAAAGLSPARVLLEELFEGVAERAGDLTEPDRRSTPAVKLTFEAVLHELSDEGTHAPSVDELVAALELYLSDEALELPTPSLPAEDAVQVMTVHQAKGLEFGTVFLMAWGDNHHSPTCTYDDRWGLTVSWPGEPVAVKQACRKLYGRDDPETDDARLWYVALTRAREELYVTYAVRGRAAAEMPFAETLTGAEQQDWAELAGATTRYAGDGSLPALLPTRLTAAPSPPPLRLVTSFSALRQFALCPASWWIAYRWRAAEELFREDTGEGDGSSGAAVGNCVHRFIGRFYRRPHDLGEEAEQIARACRADGVSEPQDQERVRALIAAFRASRWSALRPAPESLEREVRLRLIPDPLVEVGGRIDLLTPPPQQRIVDFKTNERLTSEALGWYAMQLALYHGALEGEGFTDLAPPLLVHLTEQGAREHEIGPQLVEQQRQRARELAAELAETVARGVMPSPPETAPCAECPYASLCPVTLPPRRR